MRYSIASMETRYTLDTIQNSRKKVPRVTDLSILNRCVEKPGRSGMCEWRLMMFLGFLAPANLPHRGHETRDNISNNVLYRDMCFHRVHGRNARLSRNRLTASRATVYSEFNDAVLFSSRPLRECDMFELRIDKMVDCWIGSLEIGLSTCLLLSNQQSLKLLPIFFLMVHIGI